SLPRLPIPSLEDTMARFPAAVCALLSSSHDSDDGSSSPSDIHGVNTKEMEECLASIHNFLETDGPPLQKMLVEYERKGREDGTLGSFVEEFWSDAYLAPDSSVVMNLNPFFVLEDGPDTKKSKDQCSRAASLCFSAIKLASSLKNETLVPDAFKGKPLCMDQFRALFGACRVPETENKDTVAVNPDSTHVVVLDNNQMYFFQALWPDGTVAVNEEDILQILLAIRADASKVAPEVSSRNALGVLTTLPRREWASARDHIISSSIHNSTALDIVDGALFILVIDDMTPKDIHEAAANMLHGTYNLRSEDNLNNLVDYQAGTCTNRWYDKLQVIVCKDGRAGINFEHSAIDGHTALRFVSDIFADNVVSFAQSITQTVYSDRHMFPPLIQAHLRRASLEHPQLVAPRKLTFELPQCVLDKIYYAETSLSDQIVASDTFVLEFTGYGKNFIVRNKMSPDSYVQLSMQLAYYRLYGKIVSQYEPVLTKAFYHGRTEAMRTATEKAALFCKKWLDPSATNEEKLEALRVATQYHSAGIKLASTGQGIERHLFALKCIADKNGIPTPDFFSSEAYTRLNHTILSTSNCGNPSLKLFGFGPVVQDGFGIGYIIRDSGLQYSISSKHRQTKRYAHTLKQTLIDMGKLLQ
ncbi:carnitine acetyl transferase, partial [Thalassiosira pseudonana CCMP1335]